MKRLLLLLCLSSIPLFARAVNGNHDTQLWLHESVRYPLRKKIDLAGHFEQRFGADATHFYFYYLQGNIEFQFTDWLDVAPGYRHSRMRTAPRTWETVKDPMLIVYLRHKFWKCWEVKIRNQFQYRIFEHAPNSLLYRLRMEVFLPWRLQLYTPCKKFCIQPYIGDEVFFLQRVGFMENRAMATLRIPICGPYTTDLQYILRSMKVDDHWIHQSVIRWYLNVRF